ncbi:hypothetical protein AB0N20_30275 [Streptomyces griseoincarnatus]
MSTFTGQGPLAAQGIVVEDRVPLGGFRTPFNEAYLEVKDRLMGHLNALGTTRPLTGLPVGVLRQGAP